MNISRIAASVAVVAMIGAVSGCASYDTPRGSQNGNFARSGDDYSRSDYDRREGRNYRGDYSRGYYNDEGYRSSRY